MHVGELASSVGQLYFFAYLRSSQTEHLSHAFVWYKNILKHRYFAAVVDELGSGPLDRM